MVLQPGCNGAALIGMLIPCYHRLNHHSLQRHAQCFTGCSSAYENKQANQQQHAIMAEMTAVLLPGRTCLQACFPSKIYQSHGFAEVSRRRTLEMGHLKSGSMLASALLSFEPSSERSCSPALGRCCSGRFALLMLEL